MLTKYAIFSDVNCIFKFNVIDVFNPEYECIDLKLLIENDTVKEKIKDTRSGIKKNDSIYMKIKEIFVVYSLKSFNNNSP